MFLFLNDLTQLRKDFVEAYNNLSLETLLHFPRKSFVLSQGLIKDFLEVS